VWNAALPGERVLPVNASGALDLAISFDLLGKMVNVRGAGKKPEGAR
jgi:hypothetical protein